MQSSIYSKIYLYFCMKILLKFREYEAIILQYSVVPEVEDHWMIRGSELFWGVAPRDASSKAFTASTVSASEMLPSTGRRGVALSE